MPKDCVEAWDWGQTYGQRNGVDYTQSGEFLISPDFMNVRPFLVFCNFENVYGIRECPMYSHTYR